MTDAELLARTIKASGLSARRFATRLLARNERTIRRWLAGDDLPVEVRAWLTRYAALTDRQRAGLVRFACHGSD